MKSKILFILLILFVGLSSFVSADNVDLTKYLIYDDFTDSNNLTITSHTLNKSYAAGVKWGPGPGAGYIADNRLISNAGDTGGRA